MAIYFNNQPRSRSAMLGQALGGGISQGINSLLDAKMRALQNKPYAQALSQLLGSQYGEPEGSIPGQENIAGNSPGGMGISQGAQQPIDFGGLNAQQATELTKLELKNRAARQKADLDERKIKAKEQIEANKETLPVYRAINEEAKSAKNNNLRLSRMEELLKKGNLSNPIFAASLNTLSKVGIDLKSLLSADSQEFDKLSNDFLKDAKSTFGSRLTDFDVRTFLSTVPSLLQSDAGKLRVIENLKTLNDATLIRKNALNDILKENKGKRPADLEILIEDRIEPQLDLLAEKFREGYKGKLQENQGQENKPESEKKFDFITMTYK